VIGYAMVGLFERGVVPVSKYTEYEVGKRIVWKSSQRFCANIIELSIRLERYLDTTRADIFRLAIPPC
jgi:hypothetical protein